MSLDFDDENIYDVIEIEDLDFEKNNKTFYYPCPCGDKFAITMNQILSGYTIAQCPSCSLQIKVRSNKRKLAPVSVMNIFIKFNFKLFADIGSKLNTPSKSKESKTQIDSIKNSVNSSNSHSLELEKLLQRSKEIFVPKSSILVSENEEYLIYYNKMPASHFFTLGLKYTIPITTLILLIKTNPFYLTFPVMLPIMAFTLSYYFLTFLNFLRCMQNVVEEIWLDKSGNEIKIVFKNKTYRKFRGVPFEEKLINQAMVTPVGVNKKTEKNLFPEGQNFENEDLISFRYFWRKYYLTKRNFLMIARKAIYSNYEILNQIFMGKTIDFNQAHKIKFEFETSNKKELHNFLRKSNPFDITELRKKIYEKIG